jgi:regulator of sigma E protease
VLTLLVFVTSIGHYWVGRRFGIHAECFPSASARAARLDRSQRHALEDLAIPLGGYVKFLGDSDATSATPRTSRCRRTSSAAPSSASRSTPARASCWAARCQLCFAFCC